MFTFYIIKKGGYDFIAPSYCYFDELAKSKIYKDLNTRENDLY